MSATKRRTAVCVGYGDGAGRLHACGSPSLPVERTGRCIRCERLQRGTQLAHVDPFVSINDMALPGEGVYRGMVREALRPAAPVATVVPEPKPGLFALFDTPLPKPEPEPEPEPVIAAVEAVEAKPVAVLPWTPLWPHCLACGLTDSRHDGAGVCTRCAQRGRTARKRGGGVVIVWLPFAADDPARYDHAGAKRWCFLVDRTEAWRYLERRAAAGGIPSGGKAVIRAASKAGDLPETVIRRAA